MNEILLTGNMGHSDKRLWGSKETALLRFFHNLNRDFYMVGHYPHEAIWQPFFFYLVVFGEIGKGIVERLR